MRFALSISLLSLGILLSHAVPVHAGTIDPLLEEAMRTRDGLFTVGFTLTSQLDISTLNLEGLTWDQRRERIIAALEEHARVTQENIWAYMKAPPPGQIIVNVGSTWLVNAVYATADEKAIRTLAAREDVRAAWLDEPGSWPSPMPPVSSSTWGNLKATFVP